MKHSIVYREPGRFAGWPANYGIWSWGNEIVVGFTVGYLDPQGGFHARDRTRPCIAMQARSVDGGEIWVTTPTPCRTLGHRGLSADEHVVPALQAQRALDQGCELATGPGTTAFTHPDFALMCARTGLTRGARSWFYTSENRCSSWEGPYRLSRFGQTGIAARTDYLVSSAQTATLFLTAAKPNGDEGRVFCARTLDGGQTFSLRSWISPEPQGYQIMPASVRLPGGRILVAVRCQENRRTKDLRNWIDLYASDDDALSWRYLNRPVPDTGNGGNPPTLTRMADGRLCLTHGCRSSPFALQARISDDEGLTWGAPITLHAGAGNHDIGYPRTVQRPDSRMVTVYYWNDDPAGERYIVATIWDPPNAAG